MTLSLVVERVISRVVEDRLVVLSSELMRSTEVLHSIASLFESCPHVNRREFSTFVAGAIRRQPELQALEWVPRICHADRERWEREIQSEVQGFKISEVYSDQNQESPTSLRTADAREEYFPVCYVESQVGNRSQRIIGFDVYSEKLRREALEMARDTGKPTATAPLHLAQELDFEYGFLVFHPIYSGLANSQEERREKLRGFAVAVFRVENLIDAALQVEGLGITVRIEDEGEGVEIYRKKAGTACRLPPWKTTMEVSGRRWGLTFEPTMTFIDARFFRQFWSILGSGLYVAFLSVIYFWSRRKQVQAIESQMEEVTRNLSAEIEERKRTESELLLKRLDLERRVGERTNELAKLNQALQTEVSTRKQAEMEAQSASRAKSEFLANMSHEIRTPMNVIMGYAQILLADKSLHPFHRDAMTTIIKSSEHMLSLLNEILDFSKIDAGKMEVVNDDFNLVDIVREIEGMFQPQCEQKRLGLRVTMEEDSPTIALHGDEGKLRQVLINLVSNAVKFTEQGRVILKISSEKDRSLWIFEVIDTGPGILEELQKIIFKPFQQGHAKSWLGGTGLGLSIAKRQVELLGGELQLESASGKGSRFYFKIPFSPAKRPLSKQHIEIEHLEEGFEVRALVVDDIPENREILGRHLRRIGCEVIHAENADQAIEKAFEHRPDIIFMDIRLQGTNGLVATRTIVSRMGEQCPKIVAVSASALEHEKALYMREGCDDFVAKPYRAEVIYASLANLLGVEFISRVTVSKSTKQEYLDLSSVPIPSELLDRMVMAAELHSTTVMKKCLKEMELLGEAHHRLAEHLQGYLSSCDLDTIQRILAQVPVQREVESSS